MPPIRRYLRISNNSVLETRIYLDNPILASWLLSERPSGSSQQPVLRRIVTAIRPLVIPKLKEENEARRVKGKGKKKKKNVKDTVIGEDFEVAIFLTDNIARHSLCVKTKVFRDKKPIESNSNKLLASTGVSATTAIQVDDEAPSIMVREESSDDEAKALEDIPEASYSEDNEVENSFTSGSLKRGRVDSDSLSVDDDDEDELSSRHKRPKPGSDAEEDTLRGGDDKKKMAMNTIYDGFSIYGKTLCLVVKKKELRAKSKTAGQAMMEDWITATQVSPEDVE